jgi:uncharacterized protein (DUF1697 family)
MPTFIAFLRAVNVGKRKYPMAELRDALTTAGFEKVETHIQTGNVVFRTNLRSRQKVIEALEKAMLADRGFEVPVVLMTPQELSEVYDEACDFGSGKKLQGHYLSLLAERPTKEGTKALEARSGDGEDVKVGTRAVHLMLSTRPYHEATTSNAEVERHLGVATTRNLTVITKLAEKWGS